MGAPGSHGPVGPAGKHGNRGEPVSCPLMLVGFTSDLSTPGNCGGPGRKALDLAEDLRFSFPLHRVLLVLLVLPVPLAQEVLVYVYGEDFFTNAHLGSVPTVH